LDVTPPHIQSPPAKNSESTYEDPPALNQNANSISPASRTKESSNNRNLSKTSSTDEELPKGAKDTTNLSFKDTDLRDIFRAISYQHSLNIFLDNSINKRSTISLSKVQVYDAIRFLCDQNTLLLGYGGGIFKIVPEPPPNVEPQRPKVPNVSYEGHLLSVQLKDDELENVVLETQAKTGFNILIIGGTTGSITGTLKKIEFDNGFTQLMNNNGFAVQRKNGIYVVSRLDYFVGTPGTSQTQKSGPYWVSVKDSLVTIDVTNAPLDRILPDMIRQLNSDVVFYNTLSGNVTVRATGISMVRALNMLLCSTNYTYRESDGLYFIGEKTNKALAVTKLLKMKHLRAEKIVDMIPTSITSQSVVKPVREQNGFVIIASNDVIEQMKEFLAEIDKPVAQVLIEALVVDYDLTHGSEFGIEAGITGKADTTGISRSGTYIPGIGLEAKGSWLSQRLQDAGKVNVFGHDFDVARLGPLPADFYFRVKALEEKGLANIRSRPLIATLNGQQAVLSIGTTQYFLLNTTIPYRDQNQVVFQQSQNFQTIEAAVKLEITPYVGADSMITVEIKPDFQTPVGQFNANVPPTINKRAMSSTLVIKDGETIVLGGLIEEGETESRSQVPILGSIPIIGNLFAHTSKSNHKSELIIYVTPHISYGENFQNVSVPQRDE